MSACGRRLIPLIAVFSLCGATEYYVRPTEPTNTSCPAQPCLTLSQYISDSDHYFQSNTVFKFLPGTHLMNKPVVLEGLHNISWTRFESSSNKIPNLVAEFACEDTYDCVSSITFVYHYYCCAAIQVYYSHNVIFERISLTVKTPGRSAIIGRSVSNVYIHLKTTCSAPTSMNSPGGILIWDANLVQVHTSDVSNCSYGLLFSTTNNAAITNTIIVNSNSEGMYLESTNNTVIVNASVMYSGKIGVHLSHAANATIINTTAIQQYTGMSFVSTTNTTIINSFAMHSGSAGMFFTHATNTTIINVTAQHNSVGMYLLSTSSTSIANSHASYNSNNGIELVNTAINTIINLTLLHNNYTGIYLGNATDTIISNLTALYNHEGANLMSSTNTSISNPRIMYNFEGMTIKNAINIYIINPHISYNDYGGIYLAESAEISIVNPFLIRFKTTGIKFYHTSNVMVINTTVMYSDESGIALFNTINTTIVNPTVLYNGNKGILMEMTINTSIINPVLLHNKGHGLYITLATNTTVVNPAVLYNGEYGVMLSASQNTDISNATVMHNGWSFNVPAINGDFIIFSSSHTIIHNSSFTNISTAASAMSTANPTSLPAVIVLYNTSLHIKGCNFTGNNVTAIKAFASTIITSGDLIFSSNRAIAGSAFVLIEDSVLTLTENSHTYFENNYASDIGGVFYIARNVHYKVHNYVLYDVGNIRPPKTNMLITICFLNTEGSRSKSRLTFVNNSAKNGGDILYGGHVAYGLDGGWNCLLAFKNISNISQTGLSLITSDPSRVCLCNESGQPDCLILADPTQHSIYPGQSISLYVVVVGQDFGTVAGSVYAQFLQKSATEFSQLSDTWQEIQGVKQEVCNHLTYVIFSPGQVSEAVLILTANSRNVTQFYTNKELQDTTLEQNNVYKTTAVEPLEYSHSSIYINITFLPCPAGFMLTSAPPFKCDCNQLLQMLQRVKCYIQEQTIGRSGLVWVGMLKNDNGTIVGSQYCMFDYCNNADINVTLSNPDSQCNYNHSGILCGGCQPHLSLALGSAQCLQCSNKYFALLIPFALAGPALVFFIKLLDLTVSQGTINGLIFYANVVKANEHIFLPQRQTNPLTLFIAWLNLDLGVETCFFHGMTAYTKTWLQFVFPLYIWGIAGLIIILAKYSGRVAKVMGNNSVPALATLFLLSYAKLFYTIITALSYTILHSTQGQKVVWSADGNVDYLGPMHIPLFTVSVAVLLFLWLPYTLLLLLGQWLQRCNCWLVGSTLIKAFLSTHYDALKSKHRYWFGVLLIVRAAILLISALIPANHSNTINLCISVSAILLNYFGPIVYRSTAVALYDVTFFMNLALLGMASYFTIIVGGDQTVAAYTLIGLAFVQFVGLIVVKVFCIIKRIEKVKACLQKGPAEDDWELYEEAALLREMESDTEDEDSDGSGSVESLPTY